MTKDIFVPTLLAGPILRRIDATSVTVWLVTSAALDLHFHLSCNGTHCSGESQQRTVQIGSFAHVHVVTFSPVDAFCPETRYDYDIHSDDVSILRDVTSLYYDNHELHFVWQSELSYVAHGSCRKPHFVGGDALVALDNEIAEHLSPHQTTSKRPDMLIMSGDQVYIDDVAGPMLQAIHQLIEVLGLFEETLAGATVSSSKELHRSTKHLYQRENLLPKVANNDTLIDTFFGAKEKPVFTSVHAQNHLISLAEMLAMYLLVWSPTCWQWVNFKNPLPSGDLQARFDAEVEALVVFKQGLHQVQRLLAHTPTYMIFDDHDVTDDWNLTRGWEEIVYGNPFSKRVIGNAMTAYWLCQGWANDVSNYERVYNDAKTVFQPGLPHQDELIAKLLDWPNWSFSLDTHPMVYVMDSRTRRWRSESNKNQPSGLLDWEALCEFQQAVIGQDRVIVVSPAPIFGVKLIEAIQKIFTFFGKALTVDAENWMAHKGTANVILNIFKHKETPPQFIILSGDVHYNFVYDVVIKQHKSSPNIVQFTASGFKNAFPDKLIASLDKLNQLLYSSRSPLNWFTKRRAMKVKARRPKQQPLRTLINTSSVGKIKIDSASDAVICEITDALGNTITFDQD